MKRILTMIAAMFISSNSPAMNENHEASMNFDLEDVRPFLTELDSKFEFGLEIDKMVKFAETIDVQKEGTILIQINSGQHTMTFHVVMHDANAPDLYLFFEQEELAKKVSRFMAEWADSRGM